MYQCIEREKKRCMETKSPWGLTKLGHCNWRERHYISFSPCSFKDAKKDIRAWFVGSTTPQGHRAASAWPSAINVCTVLEMLQKGRWTIRFRRQHSLTVLSIQTWESSTCGCNSSQTYNGILRKSISPAYQFATPGEPWKKRRAECGGGGRRSSHPGSVAKRQSEFKRGPDKRVTYREEFQTTWNYLGRCELILLH